MSVAVGKVLRFMKQKKSPLLSESKRAQIDKENRRKAGEPTNLVINISIEESADYRPADDDLPVCNLRIG